MEEDTESTQKDLASCPVKMKPLMSFFQVKNTKKAKPQPPEVKTEDNAPKDKSCNLLSSTDEVTKTEDLKQTKKESELTVASFLQMKKPASIAYEDFLKNISSDDNDEEIILLKEDGTVPSPGEMSRSFAGSNVCADDKTKTPTQYTQPEVLEVADASTNQSPKEQESKKVNKNLLHFFKKQDKENALKEQDWGPDAKTVIVRAEVHHVPTLTNSVTEKPAKQFSIFEKPKRKSPPKNNSNHRKSTASPDDVIEVIDIENPTPPLNKEVENDKNDTQIEKKSAKSDKSDKNTMKAAEKAEKDEKQLQEKTEGKKLLSERLNSLDNVKISSKKSSQATLSFSGGIIRSPAPETKKESPKGKQAKKDTENKPTSEQKVRETSKENESIVPSTKPEQSCEVCLEFEVGHDAHPRDTPTEESHSHDWHVFVRASTNTQHVIDLKQYVEKVVFKLHETFRKPQREVYEPPYELRESGYGGFDLPIAIHFHKHLLPRTCVVLYDLYLAANAATSTRIVKTVTVKPSKLSISAKRATNKVAAGSVSKAKKLLNKAKGIRTSPPNKPDKIISRRDPLGPRIALHKEPVQSGSDQPATPGKENSAGSRSQTPRKSAKKNKPVREKKESAAECSEDSLDVSGPVGEQEGSTPHSLAPSSQDTPGLRRSSRRSAAIATEAISLASQNITPRNGGRGDPESPAPHSGSQRNTKRGRAASPTADTPQKKKSRKLAPIFCGGERKGGAAEVVEIEDEDSREAVQVVLSAEEQERLRMRSEFLRSGVPEALRRQSHLATQAANSAEEAPWPSAELCHVQQRVTTVSWPSAPLKLRLNPLESLQLSETPLQLSVSCKNSTEQQFDYSALHNFSRSRWDEATLFVLLDEVRSVNPAYPARRVYTQLLAARAARQRAGRPIQAAANSDDAPLPQVTDKVSEVTCSSSPGGTTVAGRKRKASGAGDGPPGRKKAREEGVEERRRGARLRLRRGEQPEGQKKPGVNDPSVDEAQHAETVAPPAKEMSEFSALQWTELYAPTCQAEMLGKANVIRKLHAWLHSWKQATDLEMHRMKKQLEKQEMKKRKSLEGGKFGSDISDFESGGSDSEGEEDACLGLCNTMLIQGPHGVGKTALVYALANQLGYKVFEVNCSERRSGRQVLQQLQEATQSHQVANRNLSDVFSTILATGKQPKKEEMPKEKKADKNKSVSVAFHNMFGKAKGSKEQKEKECSPEKHRRDRSKSRRHPSSDVEIVGEEKPPAPAVAGATAAPPVASKALDLASCSLILFEEVDVVLEEDKGFWAAVQTFINTTKRPILLTAAQPAFIHAFDPRADLRLETITLALPKQEHAVSLLQCVCLAEGVRPDSRDLSAMLSLHRGDLRRSLLTLQAWVQSGASARPVSAPLARRGAGEQGREETEAALTEDETCSTELSSGQISVCLGGVSQSALDALATDDSHNTSDDDSVVMATRRRRPLRQRALAARLYIEDSESSSDSFVAVATVVGVAEPESTRIAGEDSLCMASAAKAACASDSLNPCNTVEANNTAAGDTEESSKFNDISMACSQGSVLEGIDNPAEADSGSVGLASADSLPCVLRGVFAYQLGLTAQDWPPEFDGTAASLYQQLLTNTPGLVELITKALSVNVNFLWNNIVWVVPLPRSVVPLHRCTQFLNREALVCKPVENQPKRSRILNRDQLFDSRDESGEESGCATSTQKSETETKADKSETKTKSDTKPGSENEVVDNVDTSTSVMESTDTQDSIQTNTNGTAMTGVKSEGTEIDSITKQEGEDSCIGSCQASSNGSVSEATVNPASEVNTDMPSSAPEVMHVENVNHDTKPIEVVNNEQSNAVSAQANVGDHQNDTFKSKGTFESTASATSIKTNTLRANTREFKLLGASLESFASLTEMFSSCDAYLTLNADDALTTHARNGPISEQGSLSCVSPGLADVMPYSEVKAGQEREHDVTSLALSREILAYVQVHATKRDCQRLAGVREQATSLKEGADKRSLMERISLPVETDNPILRMCELSPVQSRLESSYRGALHAIQSCLTARIRPQDSASSRNTTASGSTAGGAPLSALAQDYLPTLRSIARTEQLRKAAKTKRRFLHYFEANHFGLPGSVIDTLSSSLL